MPDAPEKHGIRRPQVQSGFKNIDYSSSKLCDEIDRCWHITQRFQEAQEAKSENSLKRRHHRNTIMNVLVGVVPITAIGLNLWYSIEKRRANPSVVPNQNLWQNIGDRFKYDVMKYDRPKTAEEIWRQKSMPLKITAGIMITLSVIVVAVRAGVAVRDARLKKKFLNAQREWEDFQYLQERLNTTERRLAGVENK